MPRFSVFTPTHRPTHLLEAYRSLCAQTINDWEWVIVPNGNASVDSSIFGNDPRVLIASFNGSSPAKVGQLKRFAAANCSGEILVELDHDDLLEPRALELIGQAVDAGAGFVYSDFANFREDGTSEVYDNKFGWEHFDYMPCGGSVRVVTAHRVFPPNASSLNAIFFAPNHVRAWTREAYAFSGGYDASMPICDDYDLVCRTYLAGVPFAHIPECLYLYRLHSNKSNTYLERNAEIQLKQQEVSDKYRHRIVAEWCRREGLPTYELGGGMKPAEGYRNLDLKYGLNVRSGIPLADNSVGAIRAFDFLEHIPHCRDSTCNHEIGAGCVVFVMNEIYRVLVPGGWLLTGTPSTDGRGAFQDPTHCSFWNSNSTWYYTRSEQAKFIPGNNARFQTKRLFNGFPNDWAKTHEIVYMYWDAVALKGQREPGLSEI